MHNERARILVTVIVLIGFGLFIGSIAADGRIDHNELRDAGVMTTLLSLGWLVTIRLQQIAKLPTSRAYEDGYEHGRQDGTREGRRMTALRLIRTDEGPDVAAGAGE